WVYACVKAIANNVAAVTILPYVPQKTKDESGKEGTSWVVNERHEFFNLLESPNAYMSGYSLREYTAAALSLTGNAYWFLERMGRSEIVELWPLIPDQVRAVGSKEKMIDHYVYRVNGVDVVIGYDEIIHFRNMNPSSLVYGEGPLAAAKNTVATDIFAQIWNKAFFQNSARPDGVLQSDNNIGDDARKRIVASWQSFSGGPKKHGKTAILDGGLKYQPITGTAKDMDFVNLRKDLRTEILAAFGVPPSVVGLLEFANYSNMEQQFKNFWSSTLLPMLTNMQETLTLRAKQITFDLRTEFQADLAKVQSLQPDFKTMAETAQILVNAGIPINQVIDSMDLPFKHVEGGDEPRQPAPAFGDAPPRPAEDEEDAAPAKGKKGVKLVDDPMRNASWKLFDSVRREHEEKFRSSMVGFFRGQRRRVTSSLGKNPQAFLNLKRFSASQKESSEAAVRLIFDLENEGKLMAKTAERLIKGTYFDFAVRMGGRMQIDFDLNDPVALAWIKAKSVKLAVDANRFTLETISDEVADAVQEAVAAGFAEGETIAAIEDRINSVYEFAVETRAERIARTEVVSASNAGNLDAIKQAGAERKEWLSSRDEKVRETHDVLDGTEVPVGEDFVSPSGATLAFPGDPNAPGDEVINCRCVVVGRAA
ncbi:MAG TPA: phage portal protein, partial [Candidatus Polarisedimenticolaceae bacterium]|nr:phage portal protein [Candidatus Polarisedimenticolaceae bacterium]